MDTTVHLNALKQRKKLKKLCQNLKQLLDNQKLLISKNKYQRCISFLKVLERLYLKSKSMIMNLENYKTNMLLFFNQLDKYFQLLLIASNILMTSKTMNQTIKTLVKVLIITKFSLENITKSFY